MAKKYRARSATTGRWVPLWWAKRHPDVTVVEAIDKPGEPSWAPEPARPKDV